MREQDQVFGLAVIVGFIAFVAYCRGWRPTGTAFGTARFAAEKQMKAAGMLGRRGLVLGLTLAWRRQLIRLPRYTHILLVGPTGSGKGVSFIIPWLCIYAWACVCFDPKGDLFATCGRARRRRGKVYRLAPFNGGTDTLNPLDLIQPGPLLVDAARALAEAVVVRTGMEHDEHWNASAVMVICGVTVFVLLVFQGHERSLNSVREIISDPGLLDAAVEKLVRMGGIPARMGNHIRGLQDKERAGVLSTVTRHLAFLDSELVERAVATSSFDPRKLRRGDTVFIQIPPELLDAQRGLLRCWIATLVKAANRGSEAQETLFLLDEASALSGLPALEETLVRGRSGGVRLMLAYQSDAQVTAAFREKPDLIYANCSTQIYLGANSYETAERLSKILGDQTIVLESAGTSRSYNQGGHEPSGAQVSHSRNWQEQGRPLMRPEEILTMSSELLIAFVKDLPPILARRIKWYTDPLFWSAWKRFKRFVFRLFCLIGVVLFIAILMSK